VEKKDAVSAPFKTSLDAICNCSTIECAGTTVIITVGTCGCSCGLVLVS